MWGSRDPLISPEQLKLETSNLAQRWIAVSTNENAKLDEKRVTWGYFWNFGTPVMSPER